MVVEVTPAGPHVSKQRRRSSLGCRIVRLLLVPLHSSSPAAPSCHHQRSLHMHNCWTRSRAAAMDENAGGGYFDGLGARESSAARHATSGAALDGGEEKPTHCIRQRYLSSGARCRCYHSCYKVHSETTVYDPIIGATQQGSLLALQSSLSNMQPGTCDLVLLHVVVARDLLAVRLMR